MVLPQQTGTVASNIKSLQAIHKWNSAIIVTLDAAKYSSGDNFNDSVRLLLDLRYDFHCGTGGTSTPITLPKV